MPSFSNRALAGLTAALSTLALAQQAAAQAQTIVLQESGFAPGSYAFTFGSWGASSTASLTGVGSGGNSGPYVQFQINVAAGFPGALFASGSTAQGVIVLEGQDVSPAALFGVSTLRASVDSRFISATIGGCNCSGQGFVVRQNGALYFAPMPNTNGSGAWVAQQSGVLTASNFGRIVYQNPLYFDSSQRPDFSPTGAPFSVGIARANSNGPGPSYPGYSVTTGLDNLIVTITGCAADVDLSGFLDSDDFVLYIDQFSRGCSRPGFDAFGANPACSISADFDGSGFIDSDDFVAFVQAFSVGC
jgi:hypothetical protein